MSAAAIQAWRDEQEKSLRADNSWLTVAGLFWLNEGDNTVGSGEQNDLVFPAGSCPERLGVFHRSGTTVTFTAASGVAYTINGTTPKAGPLQVDGDGKYTPDTIEHGKLSFFVVTRQERIGIRLRDNDSQARRDFTGRVWYAYDPSYVVEAAFTPATNNKTIAIQNILGYYEDTPSAGTLTFTLHGQTHTLEAIDGKGSLFIIMRDKTSGHETYGAGRFLFAAPAVNGVTTLDFNKAVSPPCAFTAYATCPMAPPANHLQIAIPVGEKYVGEHH